eukprot:6980216-Heterocapsa_arctica.AAC.1
MKPIIPAAAAITRRPMEGASPERQRRTKKRPIAKPHGPVVPRGDRRGMAQSAQAKEAAS